MDFSTVFNRRGTGSLKWDKYSDENILPMWVADMDFQAMPQIKEALKKEADYGIFGYNKPTPALKQVIVDRMQKLYDWTIKAEDIIWLPGVVPALNLVCRAIGESGDKVMTTTPIYPPFLSAPGNSDRVLNDLPLKDTDQYWEMDFDALEEAVDEKTKLYLFCNPHNPVGRVYSREELEKFADFCTKHDLVICSDEIHCDLILDEDKPHIPTATLSEEIAQRCITLMAPSKTFNIPGLTTSFAIIQDPKLRLKFMRTQQGLMPEMNNFGLTATKVAYEEGEEWRQALLTQLRENRDYLTEFIKRETPMIEIPHIESTYLAWLKVDALGLDKPAKHFEEHGLGLSDGGPFKDKRYLRLNFGCPKSVLEEGLKRFKAAIDAI